MRSGVLGCLALMLGGVWIAGAPSYGSPMHDFFACYKQQKYGEAIVKLEQIVSDEPQNVMAHYYKADVLARLGKHKAAAQEYQAVLTITQDSTVGEYCRKALQAYTRAGIVVGNRQQAKVAVPIDPAKIVITNADFNIDKAVLPRIPILNAPADPVIEFGGQAEVRLGGFDLANRADAAQRQLDDAQKLTALARNALHARIRTGKLYGESDEEFKLKLFKAEEAISPHLEPYLAHEKKAAAIASLYKEWAFSNQRMYLKLGPR